MQRLCTDDRTVLLCVHYHRIFFPCLHCKLDTERSIFHVPVTLLTNISRKEAALLGSDFF